MVTCHEAKQSGSVMLGEHSDRLLIFRVFQPEHASAGLCLTSDGGAVGAATSAGASGTSAPVVPAQMPPADQKRWLPTPTRHRDPATLTYIRDQSLHERRAAPCRRHKIPQALRRRVPPHWPRPCRFDLLSSRNVVGCAGIRRLRSSESRCIRSWYADRLKQGSASFMVDGNHQGK